MDVDGAVPALEELLGQAAWVRRLARSLTLDDARAEDATQDAFVAALERPPRSARNPRGWFASVLANAARSAGRAEGRRARRERASARPEALPSAAELAGELEWQRRIAAAVLALDEPYRTTLLLHFYRGLAPAEIARRRGEPAATVRSHLKRGLDQLRARFDREHRGERRAWSVVLAAWTGEDPEVALAATSGLAVAAWIGLALLASGGSWFVWSASRSSAPASSDMVAAAPVAPPPSHAEELPRAEPSASAPAPSARVASAPLPKSTAAAGPLFIGSVHDPDGAPIEGAALAIYPNKSRPRPEPVGRGVTGPDGRFAFPIGPTDSTYLMIGAEAEGYQGMTMDPVIAEKEISIELTWQVELFGVVRDGSSGMPLAGVELSNGGEGDSARSDERGNYRLGGYPSGLRRSIRARLAGYASTEQEVLVRGKEDQRLDLELVAGSPVQVEVFDRVTGQPLAGAAVADPWRKTPWTMTAADGRFTTWVAREHPLELDVTLEGYWPLTWEWTPGDADLVATPRLPMARKIWIRGRIADEHDARIEGDWLYPEYQEPHIRAHQEVPPETLQAFGTPGLVRYGARVLGAEAEREADGRYRLPILPSAFSLTLKAGAKGYVTVSRGPFVLEDTAGDTVIDFVLARAGTLHGKTLLDGKTWVGHVVRRSPDGASEAFTSALGRYTMPDVPAGTWVFSFRDRNGTEQLPFTLTVEAGRDYEHDFVRGDERSLGVISGRVLGASDRDSKRLFVGAAPRDDPRGKGDSANVAADGTFVLRVPAGHAYSVAAWRHTRSGSLRGEERVVVPDVEGLELRPPDIGSLRMCLVDAASGAAFQPSSRFLVNALQWKHVGDDSRSEHVEIDMQGCLELELPLGPCEIQLDLAEEGCLPVPTQTVTIASTPVTLSVEIVRGIELRLQLIGSKDLGPAALEDHLFFLVEKGQLDSISGPYPEPGPPANQSFGGNEGIQMRILDATLMNQMLGSDAFAEGVLLRALVPGHYFVKAYPDDFVFEPAEFELAGPEKTELEIRWRAK